MISFSVYNILLYLTSVRFKRQVFIYFFFGFPVEYLDLSCRKLILYGYVYDVDYSYLRNYNTELGRISSNLNQIAKRVNSTGNIYQEDINEVKELMNEVWQSDQNGSTWKTQLRRDINFSSSRLPPMKNFCFLCGQKVTKSKGKLLEKMLQNISLSALWTRSILSVVVQGL